MSVPAGTFESTMIASVDRLTHLLELALAPELDARRAELRSDPIDAAIFDNTASDWIAAADLQQKVNASVGVKPRTLQLHLSKLIDSGLVEHRGGKRYAEYHSSGLI
jgi:hypothetical protein